MNCRNLRDNELDVLGIGTNATTFYYDSVNRILRDRETGYYDNSGKNFEDSLKPEVLSTVSRICVNHTASEDYVWRSFLHHLSKIDGRVNLNLTPEALKNTILEVCTKYKPTVITEDPTKDLPNGNPDNSSSAVPTWIIIGGLGFVLYLLLK